MNSQLKRSIYKTRKLTIRASQEEVFTLNEICQRRNISLSNLVRRAINEYAVKEQEKLVF